MSVKIMSDGRELCLDTAAGRREYRARTLAMRLRQGCLCRWCGHYLREDDASFDHENLRGAGKQDDRIEIAGKPVNAAVHLQCNFERGSRRILTQPTGSKQFNTR